MGSAASTKLQCPKDYEKDKFDMILKLFDKLDQNGDRVVETKELKEITELHVKNRIRLLNESEVYAKANSKLKITQLENKKKTMIEQVNQTIESERRDINEKLKQLCETTADKIASYNNMSEEEKSQRFLEVISDKNNHIEFWKFFDYMKEKTNDIQNIDF